VKRHRLTLAALALGVGTMGGLAIAAGPAFSDASPGCTATAGVTVIVDFTPLGGQVMRGCAPGTPATGLAALQQAGFTVTGTQRYGDAFVCRIDGLPTANQQACVNTPPANAYWAYFHALPGQAQWTYSTGGAASYQPSPGSIDGWAFGSGAAPSVSPSAAAPTTTPTTVTVTSTSAAPPAAAPGPRAGAGLPAPASPPSSSPVRTSGTTYTTGSATPPHSAMGGTPSSGTRPGPGSSSSQPTPDAAGPPTLVRSPRIVNVSPQQRRASAVASHDPGSSPVGFAVGLLLVIGVITGGLTTLWRRRKGAADRA
jgi:hypothetical protein